MRVTKTIAAIGVHAQTFSGLFSELFLNLMGTIALCIGAFFLEHIEGVVGLDRAGRMMLIATGMCIVIHAAAYAESQCSVQRVFSAIQIALTFFFGLWYAFSFNNPTEAIYASLVSVSVWLLIAECVVYALFYLYILIEQYLILRRAKRAKV